MIATTSLYELVPRFSRLFSGLDQAFGTGRGQWVKRPPRPEDWCAHLQGKGSGIGIAPLRPDNTVLFAAIDLDQPDFDSARSMQEYIPGTSWIERSRSGNAHVWVFFKDPIEAYIPMGILKAATLAAGKEHVEVFPKNHDFSRVRLGNYINLPYHGKQRPILGPSGGEVTLESFIGLAEERRNEVQDWHEKAHWLQIMSPEQRERTTEFGTQQNLHICAQHVISGNAGPITEGGRHNVYFALARQLTNCVQYDGDEVREILDSLNAASPDPLDSQELHRIIENAERGQYTSTGCDDPLFQPYSHPDCPIANPRR